MKTTTYKCDRCGAEDTTNKINLDRVGVFVGHYERSYTFGLEPKVELTQEWCLDCRIKTGLTPAPTSQPPAEVSPVTLEDMIREMMREEIQAASPR